MNNEKVDRNDALEPSSEGFEQSVEVVEEKSAPGGETEASQVVEKPVVGKGIKFPTWTDFFAAVGVFVFSVLVGSVVAILMSGELTPKSTFVYYLVQMLPTIIFVMWRRHRAGRDCGIHFGLRRVHLPTVLWGLLLLFASSVVLEPLLILFPVEEYEAVLTTLGTGGWAILSTVVAAPILEEVLFRGLVFESFRERFGRGVALLASALLFGLIHMVPVQMINAFVVGLILGYIYLRTRSLLAVILLHSINNAIAYVSMVVFGNVADYTLRGAIHNEGLYWTIYAIASVLFLWAMIRLWVSLRDNTEVE